jgi:hypothetical protein
LAHAKYRRPSPPDSTSALLCWHNPQTLFAESLLVPTTAASEELGEHHTDDANVDPDDYTQAVMRQTNDLVANMTDRPISRAQMPSDWWKRMLLGASDDAVGPEMPGQSSLTFQTYWAIKRGSVQKVLQKKEVMVRGWISKPQPRIEP